MEQASPPQARGLALAVQLAEACPSCSPPRPTERLRRIEATGRRRGGRFRPRALRGCGGCSWTNSSRRLVIHHLSAGEAIRATGTGLALRHSTSRDGGLSMPQSSKLSVAVLIVGLWTLPAAQADPVPIHVGGMLQGDGRDVTVSLRSHQRGFSLDGGGSAFDNNWGPGHCSGARECLPGQTLTLASVFSGGDFGGRAAIDGRSYPVGFGDPVTAEAFLEFAGRGSRLSSPAPSTLVWSALSRLRGSCLTRKATRRLRNTCSATVSRD